MYAAYKRTRRTPGYTLVGSRVRAVLSRYDDVYRVIRNSSASRFARRNGARYVRETSPLIGNFKDTRALSREENADTLPIRYGRVSGVSETLRVIEFRGLRTSGCVYNNTLQLNVVHHHARFLSHINFAPISRFAYRKQIIE